MRPAHEIGQRFERRRCAIWIITQDGVYSVTAYDPRKGGDRDDATHLLIVRARVRADLERIARWIGSEVLDTASADYPFRVVASREAWIDYLTAATNEVDYTNFKDRASSRLGRFRHDVLLSVWSALRRLEHEPPMGRAT